MVRKAGARVGSTYEGREGRSGSRKSGSSKRSEVGVCLNSYFMHKMKIVQIQLFGLDPAATLSRHGVFQHQLPVAGQGRVVVVAVYPAHLGRERAAHLRAGPSPLFFYLPIHLRLMQASIQAVERVRKMRMPRFCRTAVPATSAPADAAYQRVLRTARAESRFPYHSIRGTPCATYLHSGFGYSQRCCFARLRARHKHQCSHPTTALGAPSVRETIAS